jgi:hypothetical protein
MEISIDNFHTKKFYEHIEKLYQLRDFSSYTNLELNKLKTMNDTFKNFIDDLNINQILKEIELLRVTNFKPYFNNLLYVFIVMTMEHYFNDILRLIYKNKIECLKNNQMSYTREELINFGDYDTLFQNMIEDEIFRFDIKYDYIEKINYFESKFKLDLSRIKKYDKKMTEIYEIRNVIVHNDSKINKRFMEKNRYTKYSMGDTVLIDLQEINSSIENIKFILTILDENIMDKFFSK